MINDIDDFFDLDDFAEPIKLNGKSALGIYDQPRIVIEAGFETTVGYSPQITCKTADVLRAKVEQDTLVIVRKKEYLVQDITDDGTGITVLRLQEK